MTKRTLRESEASCSACGFPKAPGQDRCPRCGVASDSGRHFWKIFWGGIIIGAIVMAIGAVAIVLIAPHWMPHLFKSDFR